MKSFTDNAGRNWTVAINVGTIKRIRAFCDVNILDIIKMDDQNKPDAGLLEQLAGDPVLLVDVLYAACKDEADKANISDIEFGRAMSGDAIESATRVLLEEIVDFFPEAKRRVFQKVLAATRRFEEAANKKLQVLMDSGDLDRLLDSKLNELNDSSMSAPESAE